jgi:hypothetical protein
MLTRLSPSRSSVPAVAVTAAVSRRWVCRVGLWSVAPPSWCAAALRGTEGRARRRWLATLPPSAPSAATMAVTADEFYALCDSALDTIQNRLERQDLEIPGFEPELVVRKEGGEGRLQGCQSW